MTAIAYTPIATPAEALAAPAATSAPAAGLASATADDSDGPEDGAGSDEDDGPPPCLPGNAPSAVTGRCVPDFPEHECPDGGMSVWNRCPRSAPCAGGGASVNGECPGPVQRFCEGGVSFEGSCREDSEDRTDSEDPRLTAHTARSSSVSPLSPVFG
ncbi:hypothetical protein [Segniliparus rugosus]|uniref:hypothetical protein n=1 Tax=Segniliparus rugosus TaxID=286804 RepID=UPI0012EC5266|nr:hypothetical protein [Segniliparus rugosus]